MSNDANDIQRLIADAIEDARDGALDGEQLGKVRRLLSTSAEARRFYLEHNQLSQMLASCATPLVELGRASLAINDGGQVSLAKKPAGRRANPWLSLAMAASFVLVAIGIAYLANVNVNPATPGGSLVVQSAVRPAESDAPVAVLVASSNAEWSQLDLSGASGVPLRMGWLDLDAGSAVIQFNSGALVTLEGPARFRLLNAKHGYLERGQLAAHVPEQAIGFRIDSPTIQLTDLGTEFHIDTAEDGTTEVQVLDGAVEVQHDVATGDTRTLELRENEARAFPKTGHPKKIAFKKELRRKAPSARAGNRIGIYTFDSSGSGTEQDPWVTDPSAKIASAAGVRFHDFTFKGVNPGPTEFKENLNRWSFKSWLPEYAIENLYVAFAADAVGNNELQLNRLTLQVFRAGGEAETTFAPRDGLLCVSSDGFKSFTELVLLEDFSATGKPKFRTVDLSRLPPAKRFEFRFVFKGPTKARAIRLDEVTLDVDIEDATE